MDIAGATVNRARDNLSNSANNGRVFVAWALIAEKRFEEALEQAKQEPITKPSRDFDLD